MSMSSLKKEDQIPQITHEKYPVDIYIDDQASIQEELVLIESMRILSEKSQKNLFNYLGRVKSYNKTKDSKNVVYFSDKNNLSSNEQGKTFVSWEGAGFSNKKIILEFDIFINKKDFRFSYSDEVINSDETHLKSLLIHELCHALGIFHSDHNDSIMNPYLPIGQKRLEIVSNDLERILSL